MKLHGGRRGTFFARGARVASFDLGLALDADRGGDIQPMEVANAAASLRRLDVDHDGALSRRELRAMLVAGN